MRPGQSLSAKQKKGEVGRLLGQKAILSANDLVGFAYMHESGIAETTPGVFCRTVKFGNLSYSDERKDVKDSIYDKFSELHAYFPPRTSYQINLINFALERNDKEMYLPEYGDNADLAEAYNEIFALRQREGRSEFKRENYLTFSTEAEDMEAAEGDLASTREGVVKMFKRLKVKATPMSGMDRMRLHHDLIRGSEEPFLFDYARLRNSSRKRARDFVAPSWAAYREGETVFRRDLTLPGHIVKAFHIRDFGSDLSDRAIRTIRALPIPMNISLRFEPQVKSKSISDIRTNINVATGEIFAQQKEISKAGGDITLVAPALEEKVSDNRELLEFVREEDQLIGYFQGLIVVYAKNPLEMKAYERALRDEAGTWSIDLVEMPMAQEDAFVSALPLSTTRLPNRMRSLTTDEGAVMIPFSSQNIHDDPLTSYMLGWNTLSMDSILVDPGKLKSPHMWVFGMTGAGKGMAMNSILTYMLLQYPHDPNGNVLNRAGRVLKSRRRPQVFTYDFHGEYVALCDRLGGKNVPLGPEYDTCINPLDLANEAGVLTKKLVQKNTDFFLALASNVMGRELDQLERSILDRCLGLTYGPHINTETRPILEDLHASLHAQDTPLAEELAVSFEIFVRGSMNACNGQTNVEDNMYWTNYDCSELGTTMETFAMLSTMQHVRQCAYRNFREGRLTYLVIEEAQVLFDNDAAVRVLDSFFSEMRKYGLRIICVTQLPQRVLEHPRAKHLFDNTGLFVFLAQLEDNADLIARKFKLSATQKDCMAESSAAGSGLVIADGVKLAMSNTIPRDNPLYEIWNTDPEKMAKVA